MFTSIKKKKNEFVLALLKNKLCLAHRRTLLNLHGPKPTMIYVKWDDQRTRFINPT